MRRSRSHFIKRDDCRREGGGTARSAAGRERTEKPKESREQDSRGVNLIFYSAVRSWCASISVRVGLECVRECLRTEAPRHLGCETGDMPWKNPTDPLLILHFLVLLHLTSFYSLALLTDWKNSLRIPDFKTRAIKSSSSSSSWYATRVCMPRKSRLQVHRGNAVSTAGI